MGVIQLPCVCSFPCRLPPQPPLAVGARGCPIVPHQMDVSREKEVILQTPFGTFHRSSKEDRNCGPEGPRPTSPEPLELDLPSSDQMPRLSPMGSPQPSLKPTDLSRKRPASDGHELEKDPKVCDQGCQALPEQPTCLPLVHDLFKLC